MTGLYMAFRGARVSRAGPRFLATLGGAFLEKPIIKIAAVYGERWHWSVKRQEPN
jgi:hypothetical protein